MACNDIASNNITMTTGDPNGPEFIFDVDAGTISYNDQILLSAIGTFGNVTYEPVSVREWNPDSAPMDEKQSKETNKIVGGLGDFLETYSIRFDHLLDLYKLYNEDLNISITYRDLKVRIYHDKLCIKVIDINDGKSFPEVVKFLLKRILK